MPENVELLTTCYAMHGVPEEEWQGTLAVFFGEHWWTDRARVSRELPTLLAGVLQDDASAQR